MMTRATIAVSVAALAVSVLAQPRATLTEKNAYLGVVAGSNVHVRSGPSRDAYALTRLPEDRKVTVVSEEEGWLMIQPPPDCYSVVEQKFVQLSEDGKTGTITEKNSAFARHAGPLRQSGFSYIQCRLKLGQKVDVLGLVGEYCKIVSPPGAYFWIAKPFVTRYRGPRPAGKSPAKTAASAPAAATDTTKDTSKRAAGALRPITGAEPLRPITPPKRTHSVGLHGTLKDTRPPAARRLLPKHPIPPRGAPAKRTAPLVPAGPTPMSAWQAAERALQAECRKPSAERDYQTVLGMYQAVDTDQAPRLSPYVAERVGFLEQSLADAEAIREAQELLEKSLKRQRELEIERTKIEIAPPRRMRPLAVKGVVVPSGIFTGGAAAPKRYMLRQPDTRKVRAYLQCNSGTVDLQSYVDKYVAVTGQRRFDDRLPAEVIEVEQVTVLEGTVHLPSPPKPRVTPLPPRPAAPKPPAPKPATTSGIAEPIAPKPAAPKPTIAPKPAAPPTTVTPKPVVPPTTITPKPVAPPPTIAPKPVAPPPTIAPKPVAPPTTITPKPVAPPPMIAPKPAAPPTTITPKPVAPAPKTTGPPILTPRPRPTTPAPKPVTPPATVGPKPVAPKPSAPPAAKPLLLPRTRSGDGPPPAPWGALVAPKPKTPPPAAPKPAAKPVPTAKLAAPIALPKAAPAVKRPTTQPTVKTIPVKPPSPKPTVRPKPKKPPTQLPPTGLPLIEDKPKKGSSGPTVDSKEFQ